MANNLTALRLEQKLTQKDLGELMGVTKGCISAIETNRVTSSRVVEKLADLFQVSVRALISTDRRLIASKLSLPELPNKPTPTPTTKERIVTKPFVLPKASKVVPMYAVHPLAEKVPVKEEVLAEAEKQIKAEANAEEKKATPLVDDESLSSFLVDKGIVQVLTCTAGAANKYLSAGWLLIATRSNPENNEFLVLLGSKKPFSSEDFDRLKSASRASSSAYKSKTWRGYGAK